MEMESGSVDLSVSLSESKEKHGVDSDGIAMNDDNGHSPTGEVKRDLISKPSMQGDLVLVASIDEFLATSVEPSNSTVEPRGHGLGHGHIVDHSHHSLTEATMEGVDSNLTMHRESMNGGSVSAATVVATASVAKPISNSSPDAIEERNDHVLGPESFVGQNDHSAIELGINVVASHPLDEGKDALVASSDATLTADPAAPQTLPSNLKPPPLHNPLPPRPDPAGCHVKDACFASLRA